MGVNVSVSVRRGSITLDASAVDLMALFGVSPAAFKRAQVRALNKTIRWMHGKFARYLQDELRSQEQLTLTQALLKKRMRQALAKGSALQANLWIGLHNLPLIRFGKGRKVGTGYRVKSRQVDGGFLARMPGGHEGVYSRKERTRLHIKESKISLRGAASTVFLRLLPLAEQELEKKLRQELNYEMHRASGSV